MHGLRMFDTAKIKELYDTHYSHLRELDEDRVKHLHQATLDYPWITCRDAVNLVKDPAFKHTRYKI